MVIRVVYLNGLFTNLIVYECISVYVSREKNDLLCRLYICYKFFLYQAEQAVRNAELQLLVNQG